MSKPKFYVTTPIYYVNDTPHVGSAYTTIAADILARFYRLSGYEVYFLTGSDEHGQKIEVAARSAGMEPKAFVDNVVKAYKKAWVDLNISNDAFIRTTDEYHVEFCKTIFKKMNFAGDIYKGLKEGLYCVGCEKFLTDTDIVDGMCPLHKIAPEFLKEENYFFRLSRYQQKLLEYYEKNPDFISPVFRKQEIINRVRDGLIDLSVSRTTIKWGIPIPDDPDHVMYVWIDALSNYISALGYPGEKYQKFWPADVHLVGKDILWFHTVIWPAMLMSAGLPLPHKVFAHGFWTVDRQKMSKSLHNVVDPLVMKKKYGLDAFRYYLFSKSQFGQDSDFSEKELVEILNTDLADVFGNLVNRVIVLTQKYFQGTVPFPTECSAGEEEFKSQFNVIKDIELAYQELDFSKALHLLWDLLRAMNKYITDKQPWELFKRKQMGELQSLLLSLIEGLRITAILIQPVMPGTCEKLFDAFGLKNPNLKDAIWRCENGFKIGSTLRVKSLILFSKKEYSQEPASEPPKLEQEGHLAVDNPPVLNAGTVSYEDFQKFHFTVGTIIEAKPVPGAQKILELKVDLDTELRTIVGGIAEIYTPADLVGKNIVILENLEPKTLRGIKSQGMLLAADVPKNKYAIILAPGNVPKGARIK